MSNQNNDDLRIIAQTKKWLQSVVVAHNYCPFAKREIDKGSVRYQVQHESGFNNLLETIIKECIWLDQYAETETTLIVLASGFENFNSFLDLITIAEDLLVKQGYEGVYQLASFHPDYCFQGAEENDPANYTNRSPFPMLHLIREASIQIALENYPSPEDIPERNIEYARKQGLEKMKSLLAQCNELNNNSDS